MHMMLVFTSTVGGALSNPSEGEYESFTPVSRTFSGRRQSPPAADCRQQLPQYLGD